MSRFPTRMNLPSLTLFNSFSRILNSADDDAAAKEIHKLHTTARRIEAFTAYLPGKVRDKNEDVIDEIKSIRKRSGKVRDLDVQLQLLEKVADGTQPQQFAVLEDQLKQKRAKRAKRLMKEVRFLQRKKWMKRLQRLTKDVTAAHKAGGKKGEPLQAARE